MGASCERPQESSPPRSPPRLSPPETPPPPELPPRRRSCSAAVRRTSCARPRPRSRSSRKPCATPARCGASRRRRDSPGSCSGGRSGARGAARAPHSTACSLSPAWALPLIERASPASSRHPRPVPLASSTSSGGGGVRPKLRGLASAESRPKLGPQSQGVVSLDPKLEGGWLRHPCSGFGQVLGRVRPTSGPFSTCSSDACEGAG